MKNKIDKIEWGNKDGEEIFLFILKNEKMSVTLRFFFNFFFLIPSFLYIWEIKSKIF